MYLHHFHQFHRIALNWRLDILLNYGGVGTLINQQVHNELMMVMMYVMSTDNTGI